MRARWAPALTTALSAVITAVLIVGSAGGASATTPVTLGTGYVLDDVDALSASEEAQAQTRLEQLKTDTGLDLWVVSDNVRKGAATNSVQIAEILVRDYL